MGEGRCVGEDVEGIVRERECWRWWGSMGKGVGGCGRR